MALEAITTLPKTTHNTSTRNTGETSSNYSVKLSLSPHKSSHGTFLDSLDSRFVQDPGCKPAVEKLIMKSYEKRFWGRGRRGGRLIASERNSSKSMYCSLSSTE